MKARFLPRSIGSFVAMSAPIALVIACGNTNNSEENSLAKNVTNLYETLDEINASGNDQGMTLTTSEAGSKALATALLPIVGSARITYALSESAAAWKPLIDSYPSSLTIESLQALFRQSVNLDASAWSALAKNEVKVYVRIEALDTAQVSVMGERINLPFALATKLTANAQDVTSVIKEIRTKGAFTLSGPSNALVLTPQRFAGLELLVKRPDQAQFEALTPALALQWTNVWNNATNNFRFDSYDVKVRAVNGGLLYEQGSALGRATEITIPNLKVNWLTVAPLVIDESPFAPISVVVVDDALSIEATNALNNVNYEYSFNPDTSALPQGFSLPTDVLAKTWYPLGEINKILSENTPHRRSDAWTVPRIDVRASANANFALVSAATNKTLWSTNNTVVSRASEVTATYNALQSLSLSGNKFDALLSANDIALADLLFANREFLRLVYSTDAPNSASPSFTPLLPSSITQIGDAYREALQSGIAIARSNSLAIKRANNLRVKLIAQSESTDEINYEYGSNINKEAQVSTAALAPAIDISALRTALTNGTTLVLAGASNAVSVSANGVDANLSLKLKISEQANYVTPQALSSAITNWWDNENNRYVASSFNYEISAQSNGTYLYNSNDLTEATAFNFEGSATLPTSGITPRVITSELQLERFQLQGTTTEGLDLVRASSEPLPRNVTYEFSFNDGANATPISGINLPSGVNWKTWFSFSEMQQILKANNLYTYHAWKVESINARARAANASYQLGAAKTNHELWSYITNKFELQTVAPEVGNKRQYVVPSLANLKVTEYRDETAPNGYWLSEDYGTGQPTVIDRFLQKLATRLPVGPEIGALNEVVFQTSKLNTATAYYPFSKIITVSSGLGNPRDANNVGITFNADGTYNINDFELFTELVSEQIFEPFYHEYGHHLTFEYIVSDFINDDIKPYFTWQRKILGSQSMPTYDEEFFNEFVNAMHFDDKTKTNFSTQTNTYGKLTTPLSNVYSRSELFGPLIGADLDLTNKTLEEVYAEHFKELRERYSDYDVNSLSSIGPNPAKPYSLALSSYSEEYIKYFFSIDEQVPIKIMLASMLYPSSSREFYDSDAGNFWIKKFNYKIPLLNEAHSLVFSESVDGLNYAPDYLFNRVTNSDGTNTVDASHANALMAALQKRMGYTNRSAVSHIWWENTVVNDVRTYPNGTYYDPVYSSDSRVSAERFKFGGYVENDTYKYVGYFENGVFKSVPIFAAPFNLRAKTSMTATTYAPVDPTKLNFYYLTKNSVDASSWIDKPLFFSTDANGGDAHALQGYNAKASSDLHGLQERYRSPNVRTVFAGENENKQVVLRIQNNTKIMHDPTS